MSEIRDFDAEYGLRDKAGQKFVLGGHEFTTKSVAPPAAFLHEDTGLSAAVTFLRRVLIPEDRVVFDEMVENPDILISAYQLDQIAAWLVGEISGRPTESPSSSGAGRAKTSTGSKAPSLSQVKTGD